MLSHAEQCRIKDAGSLFGLLKALQKAGFEGHTQHGEEDCKLTVPVQAVPFL